MRCCYYLLSISFSNNRRARTPYPADISSPSFVGLRTMRLGQYDRRQIIICTLSSGCACSVFIQRLISLCRSIRHTTATRMSAAKRTKWPSDRLTRMNVEGGASCDVILLTVQTWGQDMSIVFDQFDWNGFWNYASRSTLGATYSSARTMAIAWSELQSDAIVAAGCRCG
jgi:hypothetical protein